jgi:hypothetical protein
MVPNVSVKNKKHAIEFKELPRPKFMWHVHLFLIFLLALGLASSWSVR